MYPQQGYYRPQQAQPMKQHPQQPQQQYYMPQQQQRVQRPRNINNSCELVINKSQNISDLKNTPVHFRQISQNYKQVPQTQRDISPSSSFYMKQPPTPTVVYKRHQTDMKPEPTSNNSNNQSAPQDFEKVKEFSFNNLQNGLVSKDKLQNKNQQSRQNQQQQQQPQIHQQNQQSLPQQPQQNQQQQQLQQQQKQPIKFVNLSGQKPKENPTNMTVFASKIDKITTDLYNLQKKCKTFQDDNTDLTEQVRNRNKEIVELRNMMQQEQQNKNNYSHGTDTQLLQQTILKQQRQKCKCSEIENYKLQLEQQRHFNNKHQFDNQQQQKQQEIINLQNQEIEVLKKSQQNMKENIQDLNQHIQELCQKEPESNGFQRQIDHLNQVIKEKEMLINSLKQQNQNKHNKISQEVSSYLHDTNQKSQGNIYELENFNKLNEHLNQSRDQFAVSGKTENWNHVLQTLDHNNQEILQLQNELNRYDGHQIHDPQFTLDNSNAL